MKAWMALCIVMFASTGAAWAGALTKKSLAPEWSAAGEDERAKWLTFLKAAHAETDSGKMAKCLDEMVAYPALATNELVGVSSLCATVIKLEGR